MVVSACLAAMAARAENRVNFVSCPIVRDTPSVPCWLSAYEGELYYLGIQTDVSAEFHPPYLGHRVLVEGVIADDEPRICGGVVLEPVRISVHGDSSIAPEPSNSAARPYRPSVNALRRAVPVKTAAIAPAPALA